MRISHSYSYRVMIVLALSFLLGGCSQDASTSSQSQLVVEGWIDAGGFPVVKLTRTIPLSDKELALDSLSRYIDRWAKVTISDGERTEVLAGRYDKKYFPPFIYTTYDMRGEAGREYVLRVEASDGKVAEARTRIPVCKDRFVSCRTYRCGQSFPALCLHLLSWKVQAFYAGG